METLRKIALAKVDQNPFFSETRFSRSHAPFFAICPDFEKAKNLTLNFVNFCLANFITSRCSAQDN
jgi:hypothetical protein